MECVARLRARAAGSGPGHRRCQATSVAFVVGMERFFCTISIIYSHLPPRKESASIGSFAPNLAFSGTFARPLHSRFCVYMLSWIPC